MEIETYTECKCNDWKENIDELNSGFAFMSIRSTSYEGYSGKHFIYCPWCSKKLVTPNIASESSCITISTSDYEEGDDYGSVYCTD